MIRRVAVGFLFALAAVGCGSGQPVDQVTYVAEDDPRMNAAIEKARSTVGTFTAAVKAPKPGQSDFSVKMPFTDGKNTEHMWLSDVRYDGKRFRGNVGNEPEKVFTAKMGQEVTAEPKETSDWMFVENGKLVGGYTLRVLRDAMSADERKEFDESVPFKIE